MTSHPASEQALPGCNLPNTDHCSNCQQSMQLAPTQRRKTFTKALLATFTGSASKASTASCLCCLHYACASASTTWLPPAAELSSNNADEPPQCSVVSGGGRCTDGQSPSNHQSDGSGFQGQPLCCCLNAKTAAVTFRHSWVDICAAASSSASPSLGWWGGGMGGCNTSGPIHIQCR